VGAPVKLSSVSIGMPVYNAEKYLQGALDSLLAQDYDDFELLISDNASTDRTQEICQEYATRDQRVRYQRNSRNIGAVDNFNRVLEQARGKYFMWAAHDDLWDSQFLQKCVRFLETNPSAVLVYPQSRTISSEGGPVIVDDKSVATTGISSPASRVRLFSKDKLIPYSSIYGLHRTEIVKRALPLPKVCAFDYVIIAVLLCLGEFGRINETLYTRRTRTVPGLGARGWRLYYQKALEPDCRWPFKYQTYWPTAFVACKRVSALPIPWTQIAQVCFEAIRWCTTTEIHDSSAYQWLQGWTYGARYRFGITRIQRARWGRPSRDSTG
jgi:glycosyltransferase involved in cell wall biosynthesis